MQTCKEGQPSDALSLAIFFMNDSAESAVEVGSFLVHISIQKNSLHLPLEGTHEEQFRPSSTRGHCGLTREENGGFGFRLRLLFD